MTFMDNLKNDPNITDEQKAALLKLAEGKSERHQVETVTMVALVSNFSAIYDCPDRKVAAEVYLETLTALEAMVVNRSITNLFDTTEKVVKIKPEAKAAFMLIYLHTLREKAIDTFHSRLNIVTKLCEQACNIIDTLGARK